MAKFVFADFVNAIADAELRKPFANLINAKQSQAVKFNNPRYWLCPICRMLFSDDDPNVWGDRLQIRPCNSPDHSTPNIQLIPKEIW